ncbi:hypothetical protein CEUSTIGMA_g7240.t1 [Chlamydomonas eustigma]|uniref:methionyl-tRNA formyltransferase n=1 Tax=Chlamydomonas eustigma TaxID=1157962 RepID=A0A250XAL1_9CHLO|nr:hypothetical protein CEUSTIGMA_g7240.t1 [Chlamydomonas eustigma]|eukprot:GAX79800.1 hypothetical protein CEUSTIGMA_g7240.t1 [Chlamydomonas eustigma]
MIRALVGSIRSIDLSTVVTHCKYLNVTSAPCLNIFTRQTFSPVVVQNKHFAHTLLWLKLHVALPECKQSTKYVRCHSISSARKSKVVFLGSPEVAAICLQDIVTHSQQQEHNFEVTAIVTKGAVDFKLEEEVVTSHENRPSKLAVKSPNISPVHKAALKMGFAANGIFTPASPKEPAFLDRIAALKPDLCITAAYGGILPQEFLDIPTKGTINIHPSLLPKYRGAAPVQRALESGETETGVSLVYTVLQCDAGQAKEKCKEQDATLATTARKIRREEALMDPTCYPATILHNKVRALAGGPGTYLLLKLKDLRTGTCDIIQAHILRSRAVSMQDLPAQLASKLSANDLRSGNRDEGMMQEAPMIPHGNLVRFIHKRMFVPCCGGSFLEVIEVNFRKGNKAISSASGAAEAMTSLGRFSRLFVMKQAGGD